MAYLSRSLDAKYYKNKNAIAKLDDKIYNGIKKINKLKVKMYHEDGTVKENKAVKYFEEKRKIEKLTEKRSKLIESNLKISRNIRRQSSGISWSSSSGGRSCSGGC